MKTKILNKKLELMGEDAKWLAEESGLSEVTVRANVMRGLLPAKSAVMLMAKALKCEFYSEILHSEEIEKLSLPSRVS